MKIGIVRHFKVDFKPKKLMNHNDFNEFVTSYDNATVIYNDTNINSDEWDRCYCSDLTRAIKTAESIYNKNLQRTELLREVEMYPMWKLKFKIPSVIWSILSRVAWEINHKSQLETINDTKERAKAFLQQIDINKLESILIVSHGFFLLTLVKELKLLGFNGDIPKRIKNGYLYILEN
ncbi:histidine phosphatase family protein [Clostridium vincentii]|uniref:2,3-bisphosphoglycerate-dependent phosphoglycerate mutase n=1 Tax=Clostridium vincentii TaxID=52704 RepID=A0A2T0BF58_9CLOT|nr:histidine phosphatase family protein [Clostridium vincentii]PRR82514.1 2,3-bisphosphoglycerate-dependent phosphoglycerate mutase [Clostridium vincentii]